MRSEKESIFGCCCWIFNNMYLLPIWRCALHAKNFYYYCYTPPHYIYLNGQEKPTDILLSSCLMFSRVQDHTRICWIKMFGAEFSNPIYSFLGDCHLCDEVKEKVRQSFITSQKKTCFRAFDVEIIVGLSCKVGSKWVKWKYCSFLVSVHPPFPYSSILKTHPSTSFFIFHLCIFINSIATVERTCIKF